MNGSSVYANTGFYEWFFLLTKKDGKKINANNARYLGKTYLKKVNV